MAVMLQRKTSFSIDLTHKEDGRGAKYKKNLHYWTADARYDYNDKQWINGLDFEMRQWKPVTIICEYIETILFIRTFSLL